MGQNSYVASEFPRRFLGVYGLIALSKIAAFSLIGYMSVSGTVSQNRLVAGVLVVVLLTLLFDFGWFYRMDASMQKELIHKRGEGYCAEFQAELNRLGRFRFVMSRWVHKRYLECFPKK